MLDGRPPVAGRLAEEPWAVEDAAALDVAGGEDQAGDARVADRAGAHRAGLQGDEKLEPRQAIVGQGGAGRAQGANFGVGGGIAGCDRGVAGASDDLAGGGVEDHRADGRFAGGAGGLRLGKGDAHGGKVMGGHPNKPSRVSGPGQASGPASSEAPTQDRPTGERVAKLLARAGAASRRAVERLIAEGRVAVNGAVLTSPGVRIGRGDTVTIDGAPVAAAEPARLFRYHKPAGLLTTHADPKGRPTVFGALPPGLPRLISVGRLDLASEGLLLLTNDGGLARALELPASGLVRRYRARARGRFSPRRLAALAAGITVAGVRYGPIEAGLEREDDAAAPANRWLSLSLAEGKNREVRRVLEALGLMVSRLIRVGYGPFELGDLAPGEIAEVDPARVRAELAAYIAPENLPAARLAPLIMPKPGGAAKARGAGYRPAGPRPSGPRGPKRSPSPRRNSPSRRRGPRPGGGPKPLG